MHEFTGTGAIRVPPPPVDHERAQRGVEDWIAAAGLIDAGSAVRARQHATSEAGPMLDAVFGNSPFLTQLAHRDPLLPLEVLKDGPQATVAAALADLDALRRSGADMAEAARRLRVAKRRTAFAAAWADINGAWPLERVTSALSDLAESAIRAAAAQAMRAARDRGGLTLGCETDPEAQSGLIVLAVGKLGARDLNYSSDIDLIVLYDAERVRGSAPDALQETFIRLTRQMVQLLNDRTGDGYVFRTDLRLRPDPGSTPIAMSAAAAEVYYESLGQNWERAAMIKARPVAGDMDAGDAFLRALTPFVWRRHLDFAAIQDIHSIKRQIHAQRGGSVVASAGHNIKLGRGGIREIEFFVQTQQLIWGGREPRLRAPATLDALVALAAAGKISEKAAQEMADAYRFLRWVEHRLQMTNDEQTHVIPSAPAEQRALAAFLGFPDWVAFSAALVETLRRVEWHYARLFEDAPTLAAPGQAIGNLVFTGSDSDPDTLETIHRLGFGNPQAVDHAIRGWHHGRVRAMRSTRARELLTELVPNLLAAFAKTANPDDALVRFDGFLARLPAGVQLFSMFYANPHLLDLVAEVVGTAPRLAELLSRRPYLLDAVLAQGFFTRLPDAPELAAELDGALARSPSFEGCLDVCRRWTGDRLFQVGVLTLRGVLTTEQVAESLTAVADTVLARLLSRVEAEFAESHGVVPGGELAVIALGKLGAREMTPASDLDLIFIYDAPPAAESSNGQKPLSPNHYFARLSQRLISALSVQTAEGPLFQVDMRLRPSGHAGPIASSREGLIRYQYEQAWTWEHMALTRARAVAGSRKLCDRVIHDIRSVLSQPCDPDRLAIDVADMRARIEREHGTRSIWNVKYIRGGLIDVEFIAQYLQLRHAHDHPDVLAPNTAEALDRLAAHGLIERETAGLLRRALLLWQGIQQVLRLTLDNPSGVTSGDELPKPLQQRMAAMSGAVDFEALRDTMGETASEVLAAFDRIIAGPAAEAQLRQTASRDTQEEPKP